MSEETPDDRLERLRKATDAVRPRANFVARVTGRLPPTSWLEELVLASRKPLALAALLAAFLVLWAIRAEHSANLALAMSYSSVEVDW